jgi:hypothetical protein
MPKLLKRTAKPLPILLVIIALACAITSVFFFGSIGIRIYQFRYIECDPRELLTTLEWVFDCNFPTDIREMKAAKTPNYDGAILFKVKFIAETNAVDDFLESFPARSALSLYRPEQDSRGSDWSLLAPRWFTETIKEGMSGVVQSVRGEVDTRGRVYIDTTDNKNTLVYLGGSYPRDSEQEKR